jgi:hypothetical protein
MTRLESYIRLIARQMEPGGSASLDRMAMELFTGATPDEFVAECTRLGLRVWLQNDRFQLVALHRVSDKEPRSIVLFRP